MTKARLVTTSVRFLRVTVKSAVHTERALSDLVISTLKMTNKREKDVRAAQQAMSKITSKIRLYQLKLNTTIRAYSIFQYFLFKSI